MSKKGGNFKHITNYIIVTPIHEAVLPAGKAVALAKEAGKAFSVNDGVKSLKIDIAGVLPYSFEISAANPTGKLLRTDSLRQRFVKLIEKTIHGPINPY